jgi:NADH dehydrogenase (ubiquinone) 1 alpha subcomplex subunit 9
LGEIAVREEFPEAIIVRTSWMYGQRDNFWNKMGYFTKLFPFSWIWVPSGGKAEMRPVFVDDVAEALTILAKSEKKFKGSTFELYGYFFINFRPKAYTFKSLVELFQDASMRPKSQLVLPYKALKPFANVIEKLLPNPPIGGDELLRYCITDTLDPKALGFRDLGLIKY